MYIFKVMEKDYLIIVDKKDKQIGTMEKLEAHKQGLLHRAFSIYLFNSKNELLLQRRAIDKYHSGGLWTNACCSHPKPGEDTDAAAHRRLSEEMNIRCELNKAFSFIYKKEVDNYLIEHELDHIYIGEIDFDPIPNEEEVMDWKFIELATLKKDIKQSPEKYTEWFKISLEKIIRFRNKKIG